MFDATERVAEVRAHFDALLDRRIAEISRLSEVGVEHFVKINPADFVEKSKFQTINGYTYQDIGEWIIDHKTDDETFLISPLDAPAETAAQVSYKTGSVERTLRASKCDVMPCPVPLAMDFFIRNHRQSPPNVNASAVCFGLVFHGELVAVMLYGISTGAVRGTKKEYELVRLAISKGTRIHGGASKLQKACEDTLREMGETKIYSYSNATINSGAVYEKLGFMGSKVGGGQPFVIKRDNSLERLANCQPYSTNEALAQRCWLKTHLGGNRLWVKQI